MFRVSRNGVWIGYAGGIEGAREIVRCEPPGSYDLNVIRADPFGFGLSTKRWGHLIRHPDARVDDQPHALPDRGQSVTDCLSAGR
jgi:hypothetical protein